MRGQILAVLVLSAASVHAADPPAKLTPFKFPAAARAPSALPPAPPDAALKLAADSLYVVQHDEPFVLIASPASLVSITRDAGPIRIRGKFIDGAGVETRTFTGKNIAIIEPAGVGRVELIAVPTGTTDDKAVVRQLIDVNNGAQPPPPDKDIAPPPTPKPPDVNPEPKPKPVITGPLFLILIEELDDRTQATANFVGDSAYWLKAKAKDIHFKTYDQDEPARMTNPRDAARVKGYVDLVNEKNVAMPALILLGKDGDVVWVKPRPKDTAAVDAMLAEVRP